MANFWISNHYFRKTIFFSLKFVIESKTRNFLALEEHI